MSKVIKVKNPVLIDRFFGYIQDTLSGKLEWLDVAYPKAERVQKKNGQTGKRYYQPVVYLEGNDYDSLLPDDRRGNYSFFILDDPQDYTQHTGMPGEVSGSCSLVFWFDYEKVFGEKDLHSKDEVKLQVLEALREARIIGGKLKVLRFWDQSENVFKGFGLDEVENQYLTHPFGGFRIECKYIIEEDCLIV